jgi:hemolysin activation/secretion protein
MEKKHCIRNRAGLCALLLLTAAPVQAQTAPPRLSVPDASHVLIPPVPPRVPAPAAPQLPQQAELTVQEQGHLRFEQVRVTGADLLPDGKIIAAFDALKGRKIPASALKPALDQVNALLADAGYPLGRVFIPAQKITDGVLVVRVVAGYVGAVTVTADSARTKALVERMAASLMTERPLTRATLERALLLIQDIPGITLGSKFEGMDPQTGATQLVLSATVKWVSVGLSLDNRANLQSLPVQPYATATFNNLLGQGDRITVAALLSPEPKNFAFYDLGYSQLVGDDGLRLGIDGAWAQTLDAVSLKPYDVRSRITRFAANAAFPLIRGKDETVNLTGGLYYADARYSLARLGLGDFASDRNLALQIGGDYARAISPDIGVSGNVRVTQGLAGFAHEPHTRLHTIAGFTKIRAEGRLAWQPMENVTLKFGALGQYSPNSLIASEEVSFGGPAYGRGFNTVEISGDSGFGLSFQPEYRIALGHGLSISPYPLLDYAKAYNRHGDLQPNGELIASGIGARFDADNIATVTLELAKPLNRVPYGRREKGWRVYAGFEIGVDGALSLIEQNL